ncbi:hypothetical protein C8F01DRAFT_637296 [Mycena amicta]|nr:hypothetical protein C8F01DRAFT_637296 [Mycena amicta]
MSHDIPPELFDEIAQRCSPSTLAVLCRVSRASQSIAEYNLYSCVEIPHPKHPRETMNRILSWSHTVLKHHRLALRLRVFSLGSRRAEELPYNPRLEPDARQDDAHKFDAALRRCVNLKKFSILMQYQLPLSVRNICQRLLNEVYCPFHLTHIRSVSQLWLRPSFYETQKDLQVVSLVEDDALRRLQSHALVAVRGSRPPKIHPFPPPSLHHSILPAESTSWKLERAFIRLTMPIYDVPALATHADTLRVLTLQRTRGLGLRLDALIALIASHLPLLLRLHIVEGEFSDARRNEGSPQEALTGFMALESFVLHLKVAVPDPPPFATTMASSRKIQPRNQVTFQPSNKAIMQDSTDPINSVCRLAPSETGLKDMAYRLLRSRNTLLHVEIGVEMVRNGGGLREPTMSCVLRRMTVPRKVVGCSIQRTFRFNAPDDLFES